MALHRDIFWIGRQWAVTGAGVQAVDQRRRSEFDIAIARLWNDELCERTRMHAWLIVEDFEKALTVARARYPAPPDKAPPPEPRVSSRPAAVAAEPPKPPPQNLAWRVERASARFLPQWRVRR